jgi:hypothetical protein
MIRVILFFGLRGEKEGGICSNFLFYFRPPSGAGIPLAFPTPKNSLDPLSPTAFPVRRLSNAFPAQKKVAFPTADSFNSVSWKCQ